MLYQHAVAISETYNTALEHHLNARLGVDFAERGSGHERRPVREIVGIGDALCRRWSTRARDIDVRESDLIMRRA